MADSSDQDSSKKNVLAKIFADRELAIAVLKSDPAWLDRLQDESRWPAQPPLRFRRAFDKRDEDSNSGQSFRVIAEIKRGSPSQGIFGGDHQPVDVAKAYAANGATALSVLTEPKYFGGDIKFIEAIRQALPEMPILMKDFFFDEAQIYQARAAGADAILLIAAHLSAERIAALHQLAASLGLSTLLEVHAADELAKAPAEHTDSLLIGINNRDLTDLSISLDRFGPVARQVEDTPKLAALPLIAESGIKVTADLKLLAGQGADGFLVGSALMATADPGAALGMLIAGSGGPL